MFQYIYAKWLAVAWNERVSMSKFTRVVLISQQQQKCITSKELGRVCLFCTRHFQPGSKNKEKENKNIRWIICRMCGNIVALGICRICKQDAFYLYIRILSWCWWSLICKSKCLQRLKRSTIIFGSLLCPFVIIALLLFSFICCSCSSSCICFTISCSFSYFARLHAWYIINVSWKFCLSPDGKKSEWNVEIYLLRS